MSRNYQPGVATKVTSARELLECLGGVDPGLDDGTRRKRRCTEPLMALKLKSSS